MRVAASARHSVRKALSDAEATLDLPDKDLDDCIRYVRKTLCDGSSQTNSLTFESEIMAQALKMPYNRVSPCVPDDSDHDYWSSLLWEIYVNSVNGTKAAACCENLVTSDEAWSDMIVLL